MQKVTPANYISIGPSLKRERHSYEDDYSVEAGDDKIVDLSCQTLPPRLLEKFKIMKEKGKESATRRKVLDEQFNKTQEILRKMAAATVKTTHKSHKVKIPRDEPFCHGYEKALVDLLAKNELVSVAANRAEVEEAKAKQAFESALEGE